MREGNGRPACPITFSIGAALLLCAASLMFGASRDLGVFLPSLVVVPPLALTVFVFVVVDVVKQRWRSAALGAILLIVSPAGYLASAALRDWVRFAAWATAHPSTVSDPGQSRVIQHWDGWGMAGSENDSYLVVDKQRALGDVEGNERWSRLVAQTCTLVATQRLWSSLYLVTTYNCPFDRFPF